MRSKRNDIQGEGINLEIPRAINRPGEGEANTLLRRANVSKRMFKEGLDVT